jgi:ankyrin repeat protein
MGSVDADTRGYYTSEDTAQRSRDSIEALVNAGADVNSAAPNGQTPLHAAAFWGWNAAVQFLVDHGAKVDVRDKQGKSCGRFRHGTQRRKQPRRRPHRCSSRIRQPF